MKKNILKIGLGLTLFSFLSLTVVSIVKAEPYGWSPNVDNSWKGPPTCTDAKPDKAPILLQPNHPALPKKPKKGEVVLYWHKVPGASGYNIYYGLSPKNYIYTAPNIGDTNNFTVAFLPNKKFYFAVQAKKGCAAGALSKEWTARPGGGGYVAPVLGATIKSGQPVKVKTTPPSVYTPPKTITVPEVKGVTEQKPQVPKDTYQPPPAQYQPPVAVPTPTPKPKSWWQNFLGIFGFGN